jgi:hypothetical protein
VAPSFRYASALSVLTLFVAACSTPGTTLEARGRVVDSDGAPLVDHVVTGYELIFVIDTGAGDVEVLRTYGGSEEVSTDANGRFVLVDPDLSLPYERLEEVYECNTLCVDSTTQCHDVEQELCTTSCSGSSWEECDECCYDEETCTTYEDSEGNTWEECSTSTVCEECGCTTVGDEDCTEDCVTEIVEVCEDECFATEEVCEWVTRATTETASLQDVALTRAELVVLDGNGVPHRVPGTQRRAGPAEECRRLESGATDCRTLDRWLQSDVFELPPNFVR